MKRSNKHDSRTNKESKNNQKRPKIIKDQETDAESVESALAQEEQESDTFSDAEASDCDDLFNIHYGNAHSCTILEEAKLVDAKQYKQTESLENQMKVKTKEFIEKKEKNKLSSKLSLPRSIFSSFLLSCKDCFVYTGESVMRPVVTLVLNHSFKTRNKIMKQKEKDSGFTRPKALILLPFKNHCFEYVQEFIRQSNLKAENDERFKEEFYAESDFKNKSENYKEIFKGNVDDCFKIGLKLTRKAVKLYASFYSSDIIIASPLGLHTILEKDDDYLSSIEVLVLDYADLFLMQNIDHVREIFVRLNKLPTKDHGCDFSRVKDYYLDGLQKYVRQTIVRSSIQTAEFNSFQKYCFNTLGSIKIVDPIVDSISKVFIKVPHVP
jgi:U3 small nucleolar RNA-associated protein 25